MNTYIFQGRASAAFLSDKVVTLIGIHLDRPFSFPASRVRKVEATSYASAIPRPDREAIASHVHIDYLYHRLFALISAILSALSRNA